MTCAAVTAAKIKWPPRGIMEIRRWWSYGSRCLLCASLTPVTPDACYDSSQRSEISRSHLKQLSCSRYICVVVIAGFNYQGGRIVLILKARNLDVSQLLSYGMHRPIVVCLFLASYSIQHGRWKGIRCHNWLRHYATIWNVQRKSLDFSTDPLLSHCGSGID
jgi:hypothetical protein